MPRGFTLAELVVSLAVSGVAFGAFTVVVAQQERTHARLLHRIRARSQATEGLATLVLELRALSPAAGDIITARDSAIELRATVATLTVCELREGAIVTALASFTSAPRVGDTAWAYVAADSLSWLPLAVTSVVALPASDPARCAAAAHGTSARGFQSRNRYVLGFAQPPPVSTGQGTPVRLTRRVRYSLYRAPDRHWYLGRRESSAVLGRFETIQPLSGPYRGYAPAGRDASGLELRYLDRADEQVTPGDPTERIARIDVTLRASAPAAGTGMRQRRDVTSIAVALRNER